MNKLSTALLLVFLLTIGAACKKSAPPAPTEKPEETLSISITPNPGTSTASALSANYLYKLILNSVPPKNGVKLDVTVTNDLTSVIEYSQSSQTNTNTISSVDLQLTNLNPGILYSVKTEVSSLSTPGNKTSISFKVARK
jgi:hypothetical protein